MSFFKFVLFYTIPNTVFNKMPEHLHCEGKHYLAYNLKKVYLK